MNTISFGEFHMKENNSVKHVKIKNTGILFELLTRQLTSDIINGVNESVAKTLIQKYFSSKSELGKEYLLYQSLAKQKFDKDSKALAFVDEVISAHSSINKSELRKQKYNLIKEIKENYSMDDFFKNKIDDYKLFASIYKLFQSKSVGDRYSPADIVESKFTILEHICRQDTPAVNSPDEAIQEYEKQNEDLRLLAYKIMIDRFNDKYKTLNESQRNLIKEYINNISSANSLRNFIVQQLDCIKKELSTLIEGVTNQVSRIKVNEVMNQLDGISQNTAITDNHVMAMLNIYELIDELKKLPKESAAPASGKQEKPNA